ncbi:hypothetical protein CH306_22240 [Rhodococcus sp. 15-725-2-2b]|nr:hypothetical protein CH277_03675 [Rhodococcus sp. 06-469-3-2]OZD42428.1 hypothetical protein CH264_21090 [Rhodococcus sp. 06-1477-1A]OZE69771.1 hypothetical protein CH306_22240 [Rhodococcus sp. 15-725-2-2b]
MTPLLPTTDQENDVERQSDRRTPARRGIRSRPHRHAQHSPAEHGKHPADSRRSVPTPDRKLPAAGQLPAAGELPTAGWLPASRQLPTAGELPTAGRLPTSRQLPTAGWCTRRLSTAGWCVPAAARHLWKPGLRADATGSESRTARRRGSAELRVRQIQGQRRPMARNHRHRVGRDGYRSRRGLRVDVHRGDGGSRQRRHDIHGHDIRGGRRPDGDPHVRVVFRQRRVRSRCAGRDRCPAEAVVR